MSTHPRNPVRFRPAGTDEPWHDLRAFIPGSPETLGGLCGEPFPEEASLATVEVDPQPRCHECYETERLAEALQRAYARGGSQSSAEAGEG